MAKVKNIAFLIIAILWLGFISCEEETKWNLSQSEPFIVLDAIITSEWKQQKVRVYSSSESMNGLPVPIIGASVQLFDGTNLINFESSIDEPGIYHSINYAASINKTYALFIEYKGIKDTAIAEMVPVSAFKNDTIFKSNNYYKFIYGGSDLPAMTEVSYDWSHCDTCCIAYGSFGAIQTFYTLNSIDIAEEFGSAKQEIWFPSGTIIVRRKYSLSPAHQVFIRSLLIETEWRGGLFDMEHGNVPSNFNHGTRGWFGTCVVISDTILVQ